MARRRTDTEERLQKYAALYRELAVELGAVGYIWNGTVTREMLTCGRNDCACHKDRARRHGPYSYWRTKVAGKSVSRLLDPEEADLLEAWIQNRRKLERLRREMLAVSHKVARLLLGKVKAQAGTSRERGRRRADA